MEIRKPLILVGLVLSLATIACDIAFGQGQSDESEAAWTEFQACVENQRSLRASAVYDEPDQYKDCFPRLSINQLEALREHDNCLVNPDCLVAIESALDRIATETAGALPTLDPAGDAEALEHGSEECETLTVEECANLGSYLYAETVVSNREDCAAPQNQGKVAFTFSFKDGGLQHSRFIAGSYEGYNGHTRIAENTYQYAHTDGSLFNIIFSQDGFVEKVSYDNLVCTFTYTYTFVE